MSGPAGDRADTASEVVVVICTDLVDSTGLSVRFGQQVADESRRRLFAASYDVIQGTGGKPVKWLGDGVMAVYQSIVAALDGAVALQRAVDRLNRRHDGDPLRLRVGLSVGEATYEDGDWYGVVVVEAARLCDAAMGGQILANAMIGALSGERRGYELRQLGTRLLKGFDAPMAVAEVGWSQWEPPGSPLPFELERRVQQRFVGRTKALTTLESVWDLVLTGTARLALVSGEPGIGKTSVAAAFAEHMRAKGAVVVYGQCNDQIVASYQPFSEALRQLVTRCDGDVLAAHAASWGGTLLTLVPELEQRVRGLGPPPVIDPETNELRLFESISDLLARVGDDAPILFVVDDLQWANAPTLRLLAYLARHSAARTVPMLMLGVYRDTPIAGEALVSLLPDLWGDPNVVHLELAGLDDAEVLTLTEAVIDRGTDTSSVELARAIRADTGGNPFLVCEVLRHLVETGALYEDDGVWRSGAPLDELSRLGRVRGVVTERLGRMSPTAARALSVASVIGDEFDFRVLERIPEAGTDQSELVQALDEAMAARLVVELPTVAGRYRFAHTLTRAAIADQLSALHRAQLHGQIATAIAAAHGVQLEEHLRDLIFHYCRGSPVIDPTPAASLGVRAARRANGQLAYADAVDVTGQVLDALDLAGVSEPELRFELLTERAFALTQSGDWDAGSEAEGAAIELAGRLQSPRALARVLTRRQSMATPLMGPADSAILAIVDQALAAAGDDDDWTMAALLAWSTMHRAANGEGAALAPLAKEAVERARRANDVELEAFALHALYLALLGSPDLSTLLDTATTLRDLKRDSAITQLLGHRFVALTMLIAGDRDAFSTSFGAMESILETTPSKFWRVLIEMWHPMLALIDGRLDEVETLTDRVLENAIADPNQFFAWFSQVFALRREQDRLPEFAPTVDAAALERPDLVGMRCVQALCRLAEGNEDAADAIVDEIARDGFAAIPRDWLFPLAAAHLTVACASLGRARDAATLYEAALPYAGTMTVCATATYVEGSADRFLGILAGLLNRFDAAEEHFDAAITLETRIGSDLLAAHTRYWYGRMMQARARPEHRRRAAVLLNQCRTDARRFGSVTLERAINALTSPPS